MEKNLLSVLLWWNCMPFILFLKAALLQLSRAAHMSRVPVIVIWTLTATVICQKDFRAEYHLF